MDVQLAPRNLSGAQHLENMKQKMLDLNKGKLPPFIPKSIKAESAEKAVFIFNIGRRKQDLAGASYGAWDFVSGSLTGDELALYLMSLDADFRAAEKERWVEIAPGEFSKPFIVPGIPHEPYWREGKRAEAQFFGEEDAEDTGYTLALARIGVGKNQVRSKSLERFGVFVSRTSPPSRSDVDAARKKWLKNCQDDVTEANEAHKVGKFIGQGGIAQEYHYHSARILIAAGLRRESDFPWIDVQAEAGGTEKCQFCGVSVSANIAKCPNCKEIINQAAFDAAQAKAKAPRKP